MHHTTPDLVTVFGLVWLLVYIVGLGLLCVAFPWMLFSVVRNISRTRKALERIAEAVDRSPRAGNGNVLGL